MLLLLMLLCVQIETRQALLNFQVTDRGRSEPHSGPRSCSKGYCRRVDYCRGNIQQSVPSAGRVAKNIMHVLPHPCPTLLPHAIVYEADCIRRAAPSPVPCCPVS